MYKVVREFRKSLRIFIKDEIIIKAPYFVSEEQIEKFFQKHKSKVLQRLNPTHLYLFGETYPICEIEEGYHFDGKSFFSDKNKKANIESFLLQRAKEYLPKRAFELADRYHDSVRCVKVNRAKSRWGSCSKKGNINLSCYLLMHEKEVIDYVIVHELAHLYHFNHSKAFWALVAKRVPNYKELEIKLKSLPL